MSSFLNAMNSTYLFSGLIRSMKVRSKDLGSNVPQAISCDFANG
jgi:hypothetical protein